MEISIFLVVKIIIYGLFVFYCEPILNLKIELNFFSHLSMKKEDARIFELFRRNKFLESLLF